MNRLNGIKWPCDVRRGGINSHVTLDGLMFDNLLFSPFAVIFGFARAKAFVLPHIFDDAIMHKVVKGNVLEII